MRWTIATQAFIAMTVLAAGCRTAEGTARTPHPEPAPAPSPVTVAAPDDASTDVAEGGSEAKVAVAGAGPVALPSKCGGTYHVRIAPRASEGEHCVVTKPIEADVTIDGSATYKGKGQASELDALAKALGLKKADLRVGAALREGVCCVDLDLGDGTDVERRLRVHFARGATIASSKAKERRMAGSKMCDAELDVTVTFVQ